MITLSDPTLTQVACVYETQDGVNVCPVCQLELDRDGICPKCYGKFVAALHTAEYPEQMYKARREQFEQSIELANLKARASAIEEALRNEFIKPEVANELLDELLDIDKKIESIDPSPVTWFEKE